MGAAVGVHIDQAQMAQLKRSLSALSHDLQGKEAIRILKLASLPIRKAAKSAAKTKVKQNDGFRFSRNGTTYEIAPRTIEKSIGAIVLRKARVPMVDVGYRTKGKYNGWFAHYVDAGTSKRSSKKGDRGSIRARNIMPKAQAAIPAAEQLVAKSVDKIIKKHNAKH